MIYLLYGLVFWLGMAAAVFFFAWLWFTVPEGQYRRIICLSLLWPFLTLAYIFDLDI